MRDICRAAIDLITVTNSIVKSWSAAGRRFAFLWCRRAQQVEARLINVMGYWIGTAVYGGVWLLGAGLLRVLGRRGENGCDSFPRLHRPQLSLSRDQADATVAFRLLQIMLGTTVVCLWYMCATLLACCFRHLSRHAKMTQLVSIQQQPYNVFVLIKLNELQLSCCRSYMVVVACTALPSTTWLAMSA